ncbi:MAG: penicillin-binding transpeptidase domain-containing protein [Patescibacteria group bacterium]|nr:penicillin-binding transpeptidase domain-containing protein [Patescibacteria group bacterium]
MTKVVFMKKLGVSFSESVIVKNKNNPRRYRAAKPPKPNINWPAFGFFLACVAGFFLLLFRAFDLQIISGAKNRELADSNRIRLVRIRAPRGIIYDRNGVALVQNIPSYVLNTGNNKFKTVSVDDALKMEAGDASLGLSGNLELRPQRQYLLGKSLGQVLGYLSEINEKELDTEYRKQKTENRNYYAGDLVGRLGIEQTYENLLRGKAGGGVWEVDALGKKIRLLGQNAPVSGQDISLTIDSNLQKIVSDNYPKDKKGAVIVSDPQTGGILALYSSPSFDPNVFSQQTTENSKQITQILNNPDSPMFDRAIAGTYPPGSTFKIVTASTGLESGLVTPDTMIEDTGVLTVGKFSFPNWYFLEYGKKEGIINIVTAIKRSNDIFFYKVGEMVGLDRLVSMAKRFGLGRLTGIDLPNESYGLVPDNAWKEKVINDQWYLGDTYHMSIGQGYLLATPLQMNMVTDVIANGGKLCQPHLLKSVNSKQLTENNNCQDIGLKKETIDLITEGMKEACSTGGTGWPFFDFFLPVIPSRAEGEARNLTQKINVACKTGTAEYGEPLDKTHAWFTMFIPKDEAINKLGDERYAVSVTVLVEGGGEGSNVAAPIAKKILEEWVK